MTRNELLELANAFYTGGFTEREIAFARVIAAAERERIKAANAPEIERINAYIKSLEDAVRDEREACAKVCDGLQENWADARFAAAIRARGDK